MTSIRIKKCYSLGVLLAVLVYCQLGHATPSLQNHEQTGVKPMTSDTSSSTDATAVVEQYFSHMREGNLDVIQLFHDDALLLGLGMRTEGKKAIEAFYRNAIATGGPQPRAAGPLLSDGRRVAAEIFIDLSTGDTLHVIDLFVVEQGRIRSLNYFLADEPTN